MTSREFFVAHKFLVTSILSEPHIQLDIPVKDISQYEDLHRAKSALDKYYTPIGTNISLVMNLFDPFRSFKYRIAQNYHGQNVNGGWLKYWEIISEFKLIPSSLSNESLITFDNAALPGNGILAINHYIKTMTNIKSHVWYAYAPIDGDDSYDLVKSYPHHWLMGESVSRADSTSMRNNGDITNLNNLRNIRSCLEGTVYLYTSDLGFEGVADYNSQEVHHAHSNLGQLLLGIYLLRPKTSSSPGGNLMVKIYTFQLDFTKSLITFCSRLFDRFYIFKPVSSRITNSECYLVGIDFIGIPEDIGLLEERLADFTFDIIGSNKPEELATIFSGAMREMYTLQISSLDKVVNINDSLEPLCRSVIDDTNELLANEPIDSLGVAVKQLKSAARGIHNQVINDWVKLYPIRSLRHKDKLISTERVLSRISTIKE